MKIFRLVFIPSVLLILSGCGSGGSGSSTTLEDKIKSGKKLASLGDVEIHEGYLALLEQVNPAIAQQLKTPMGKKRLLDNLLEQELLFQESQKRDIAKNPKFQEKAALYERVIFSQGVLEEEVDLKAKEYYDKNKDEEFTEVELAHILIRTAPPTGKDNKDAGGGDAKAKAKAEEVMKKLEGGSTFEAMVVEYSEDPMTKGKSGVLGSVGRKDRRAERLGWEEMLNAAFVMKAGEFRGPFKAKDGYHIIKVVEVGKVLPFEEAKNRIQFQLRGEVKNELMAALTQGKQASYEDETLQIFQQKTTAPPTAPEASQPQTKPAPQPETAPMKAPAPPEAEK